MSEKKQEIHVTVDNEQMKMMAEDLARARLEKEALQRKLDAIALRAETALEAKLDKLEISDPEERARFKQNPNALFDYEKEFQRIKNRGTPSGSAPMNAQQLGHPKTDLFRTRFSSEKEMVDEILRLMHEGTPEEAKEARSYYDALLKKLVYISGKKRNAQIPHFDPNDPQNLPELKEEHGFKVPVRPEEGDIGKILLMWKKEREQLANKKVTGQQNKIGESQ